MCAQGTCDECLRNVGILKGENGIDGLNGKSVLSGTGVPSNSLGVDGDFYIDKNSPFNFYSKSAGTWGFLGRLQGSNGNGDVFKLTATLTASDLIASHNNPIVIGAVPPVGTYIQVLGYSASLHYGSVAFANTVGGLDLQYQGGTFIGVVSGNLLDQIADSVMIGSASSTGNSIIPTATPLALRYVNSSLMSGNSSVTVTVFYSIIYFQ